MRDCIKKQPSNPPQNVSTSRLSAPLDDQKVLLRQQWGFFVAQNSSAA